MNRRAFFKTGVQATVAVAVTSANRNAVAGAAGATNHSLPAAVLGHYTSADHRRRLQNISLCEHGVRRCLRKHLITDYLPGQCCYNLGEYPARKPWGPTNYDEEELDRLRAHGIQVVQVFDDWNDSLRLFGGTKYTPTNPAGFRRFVNMVHRRGLKLLPYISSGFLQVTDPDLRPEWYRPGDVLRLGYWNMARCSPASPGWRAYLLQRVLRLLEDYGADGLYDDCGYVINANKRLLTPTAEEVMAFQEAPENDGALTDLLALLYAEVKRRGGIFKLHIDAAEAPRTALSPVYDYLWVGEGVGNAEQLRERVKHHRPYVVPCIDMAFANIGDEDEPYLHSIPYLQFPILHAGHPITGERAMIPGVEYPPEAQDWWVQRCQAIWKYHQANPNGPHIYSMWDSLPPRPAARATHARWLKHYLPMVEGGTWAWLEITDSDLFKEPLPKDVVASAFANRQFHLVLANYGRASVELATTQAYVPVTEPLATPANLWKLEPRTLRILRREA
jgi:hypothetical protein